MSLSVEVLCSLNIRITSTLLDVLRESLYSITEEEVRTNCYFEYYLFRCYMKYYSHA